MLIEIEPNLQKMSSDNDMFFLTHLVLAQS